jgi:hypothetical protein
MSLCPPVLSRLRADALVSDGLGAIVELFLRAAGLEVLFVAYSL